ncbi:proline dehydrogenase family protein [Pontibacter sp. HSC-36F09]|uniref:proline dehydrogenase family protein n=1 Tax=Pontibacter sp. HSC-36F09 TaxID=2910966 RepID=UPI0020A13E85|nr:proline dehydrogenase family protein [Pontibacter sp. HSC-36F09]MCP2045529.1 proline dehydrogenase [Pontibacter sp. HSC-36F09]
MSTTTIQPTSTFDPNDLKIAFSNKTDKELKLAHFLFKMMGKPTLVKLGGLASVWALKLGLPIKGLVKGTIYSHFCGGETAQEAQRAIRRMANARVHTVLDYAAEAKEDEAGFDHVLDEIMRNIRLAKVTGEIPYISVKLTGLGSRDIFQKLQEGAPLTTEEQAAYQRTENRLNLICKTAYETNITVYLDAEESWLQQPMDELAEKMMLRYNERRAVVFNTLQMYRTDRIAYLTDLLKRSEGYDVILGIKIVRGAYIEKEQERAAEHGYPSPVFHIKADTDRSFDGAIDICLHNLHRVELCAATHNEASTRYLVNQINRQGIADHQKRIHFSQLYGMSDNLTYNLASAGFNVSKYLPYGDVATTLPYMIRRAEENTSIAGQMGRELSLLEAEMKRRGL